MKRIVIYLMFLPVLIAAQPVKTKKVQTKGKETLLITLMTKYKDDILLYHYDEFGNSQGMLLGNNTLDPGSDIIDAHWKHQTTYYIPDSIRQVKFKLIDSYYWADAGNDELNKILNFDVAFRKTIEPITDQNSLSKLFDFNKTSYKQNTAAREHDIEENIKRKLTYLDQYAHANVIPIHKLASWKKSIKFEKLRLQLNLHEPEKWEKKYLTDLANLKTEFMNPVNLKFHLYRDALKYFNNLMVYLDTEKTDPSLTDYDSTIKKHFQGKTQDYLRCNILLSAVEKNSKIKFTQKQYADIVDDFLATSKTTDYKIYLQKATKKEPSLAKDILIGSDNSKTTLKEALAKGKINYVDFWASWCAPCRAEMPESKQLKQEYAQRGINFIYISIDENPAAWERAVKQVNLKSEESFLLGKGLKSDIKAEFKLTSIPRYVLLDREGKVLNFDAPRPSDPKARQLFDEMIRRVH